MRRRRPKAAFPNPKISKIIRGPSSFSHLETKKKKRPGNRAGISAVSEQSPGRSRYNPNWERDRKPVRPAAKPVLNTAQDLAELEINCCVRGAAASDLSAMLHEEKKMKI